MAAKSLRLLLLVRLLLVWLLLVRLLLLLLKVRRRGFRGVVVEEAVDLQALHVLEC